MSKPRAKRVKLPRPRFTCRVPAIRDVTNKISQLQLTPNEEGQHSSPELTRWYVAEFERLNHFIPTTEG